MTWRNDSGLAHKVVVVTGAAGAIGGAICQALAQCDAIVVGVDRPTTDLEQAIATLPGHGHLAVEADIARIDSHPQIIEKARVAGSVIGMVHVAGVILRNEDLFSITEEQWDEQHNVNLKATFFFNRAVAQEFIATGVHGSIVNFASEGWWTGGIGNSIPYAASKGGVVSLTRGLAKSLASKGIRVNSVAPGGVDTTMLREGLSDQARSDFISGIPMQRLASPDELSGAVLYLLSDASSYVTGTVLNVSGGHLIY